MGKGGITAATDFSLKIFASIQQLHKPEITDGVEHCQLLASVFRAC
jgi:hypothetical protein